MAPVGFIFHIPRWEFGEKSNLEGHRYMAGKDKTFVLTRMILLKETLEDQMIM